MADSALEIARSGFDAWRRGDFERLEQMFAPDAEWRWFERGDWDCHGRDEVVDRLRERYEQGFARIDIAFEAAGDETVIAVSRPAEIGGPEWPSETATVLEFRDGCVVSMQDYASRTDACAARGVGA